MISKCMLFNTGVLYHWTGFIQPLVIVRAQFLYNCPTIKCSFSPCDASYVSCWANKSWGQWKKLTFVRVELSFSPRSPSTLKVRFCASWAAYWLYLRYIWLTKPALSKLLMLLQRHESQRHFTSLNWHWLKINLLTCLSLLQTNCTRY